MTLILRVFDFCDLWLYASICCSFWVSYQVIRLMKGLFCIEEMPIENMFVQQITFGLIELDTFLVIFS